MDLSKFNVAKVAEIGADLELLDPVDEPLLDEKGNPVTIKLLGTDSKVWRTYNRDIQRKRMAKMVKRGRKSIDYTSSDEETCEMLATCTVGWSGVGNEDGDLEFSQEAAYELYLEQIWIREQVDAFIGDRANFFTSK